MQTETALGKTEAKLIALRNGLRTTTNWSDVEEATARIRCDE